MEHIASFDTSSLSGRPRTIDLYIGDATQADAPVDLLCISAFPNDYTPFRRGLIGSLRARGISIESLAREKAHDWRTVWQCWISQPLSHPIQRVLCFEHAWSLSANATEHEAAPDLVGNIFRAIRELILAHASTNLEPGDSAIERVRIPLLASGDQGANPAHMLESIIRQAYLSLVGQLPVKRVEIVLHPAERDIHALLVGAGRAYEQVRSEWAQRAMSASKDFDFFISYRHKDAARVNPVLDAMRKLNPQLRLFIDREQLSPGRYWKADLMSGLARSESALCFITDTYPESPECMDEFHASLCIARERTSGGFLRPLLRLSARSIERLPMSVRRVHCINASGENMPLELVASYALNGH